MKKNIIYILILFPVLAFTQNYYSISGNIKDVNGIPLANVNVLLNKSNKYAVSDSNGKYDILNIEASEYTVTVSSLGFKTIVKKILVNKNLELNFKLQEETESLDDVIITAKKTSTIQKEKAIVIGSFEVKDVIASTTIITEQIDKISGVRVRRSGSLGGESEVSINGLTGTTIRQYIDGIPLEFLYPALDIGNIPLTGIKRVDIYKGVVPVDIGTDALGGAINIITEDKTKNNLQATYSIGSFNTHLGGVDLTLANENHGFINVTGGVNYSDNNYTFNAEVLTKRLIDINDPSKGFADVNEIKKVERFHDRFKLQYSSIALGTSKKKWTDKVKLSLNYLNGSKEIQNGNTINNVAVGEATESAENISGTLLYDKTIFKDKLKLKTISNISLENLKITDSTSNKYNWLGDIIDVKNNNAGETSDNKQLSKFKTKAYINRSSLFYDINNQNRLLLSNIIAIRKRNVSLFNFSNDDFNDLAEQELIKNITGLQYDGRFFDDKLKITSALKHYKYSLAVIDDSNNELIGDDESFTGYNIGLKYNIIPELAIRGSYEKGFLIPELNQFAGNPPLTLPNPIIKSENSNNYNLGLLYSENYNNDYSLSLIANLFIREQYDIIFKPVGGGVTNQFQNGSRVDTKGLEGEVKLKFLKNFNLTANISYVDKFFVTVEDENNSFLIDKPFPNTTSFFYNTNLSWSKKNAFKTKIDFSVYGSFSHIDTFNFLILGGADTVENSPESFVPERNQFDAGFSLKFLNKQITTAFNVRNITDEEVFDNYSIPLPGRNYNLKLIYELSNF